MAICSLSRLLVAYRADFRFFVLEPACLSCGGRRLNILELQVVLRYER